MAGALFVDCTTGVIGVRGTTSGTGVAVNLNFVGTLNGTSGLFDVGSIDFRFLVFTGTLTEGN